MQSVLKGLCMNIYRAWLNCHPDFMNFVPALAYHFCLNLPATFLPTGNGNLAEPCIMVTGKTIESMSNLTRKGTQQEEEENVSKSWFGGMISIACEAVTGSSMPAQA